uniref:PH domain-containing protein n=1 Tax=Physcomitrium patens TaxID=3218 RepID=A0A2K1K489_PHYPA|nr:hypothetical protein PHYPA_013071 [Physcomitrium patens]
MEGWMVRCGRRKIGRSFFRKRYFVLESLVLAYYTRQPSANEVPIKTLPINGNCRVEDRGLKTHHGRIIYVLSTYNKRGKSHRMTMAAFNVQDASAWKEALEQVIDQCLILHTADVNMTFPLSVFKTPVDQGRNASSSDHDSQAKSSKSQPDDYYDKQQNQRRLRTVGNGPPESIKVWSERMDPKWDNLNANAAASARRHWHLVRCQRLRFFEEVQDGVQAGRRKGMKAVGVVEASCADVFELIMGINETRYDYVILFRSHDHPSCPPVPGCVRAQIESGGFSIFPLKPHKNGEPRARVQQLVHIDLKGWGANYIPFCHPYSVIQILNSVAGLREWFAVRDAVPPVYRIPKLGSGKLRQRSTPEKIVSVPEVIATGVSMSDESEFEDDDLRYYSNPEPDFGSEHSSATDLLLKPPPVIPDLSMLSGNLRKGDLNNGKNCWSIPDCNSFRIRSKHFLIDRSKASEPLMQLVAVDWFRDIKRIDHVSKRKGCVSQVAGGMGLFTVAFNVQLPGASHYSMIFYFVAPLAPQGSLLRRFVDGDDNFRNSRLKLIPSIPQGFWIVRQSIGTTPCILGKPVDCTYHRGPNYLEVDADIGSSTVANGVLGLVFGVVSALVVDMAFLIQLFVCAALCREMAWKSFQSA